MKSVNEIPSEHIEQSQLITWSLLNKHKHPELEWLYAVPNGGDRHRVVAAKLKAEGVKRGVPDLCLPAPRGEYHGLYIEMKRKKGSSTSAEQKKWIEYLREAGYRVEVCKGWEAARDVLVEYLDQDEH